MEDYATTKYAVKGIPEIGSLAWDKTLLIITFGLTSQALRREVRLSLKQSTQKHRSTICNAICCRDSSGISLPIA